MEDMYLNKSTTSPNSNCCFLSSSSPVKLEEVETRGITSILGTHDPQAPKPAEATSFRRTLSADMSSKTCLAQNGFKHPTIKKIASSGQLAIISPPDSLSQNTKKQDDVWGTIISQKKSDEAQLPPPYVHPLLKKSSSTLSEKSLEICTENLGSETGSDGFSSYEVTSDLDKEEEIKNQWGDELPTVVAKYSYSDKKMMQKHRSFPPPLSSLTQSNNEGPCLHMHSQRANGRLVLQAVAVPCTKNFQAQREDGRLRLTLLTTTLEGKEEENGSVMKVERPKMKSGSINVHRSALVMKKLVAIQNQSSTWSDNFNYTTPPKLLEDAITKELTLLPQSLPPRPPPTRLMPASYNSYEYFWRAKPATTGLKTELPQPVTTILKKQLSGARSPYRNNASNGVIEVLKPKEYQQKEIVVLRNCKEARKSLLFWDAHCIATIATS